MVADADSPWVQWHRAYEADDSPLRVRVAIVQKHIRATLDAHPPGAPFRILSLCAGQGRDVIGALADHARRDEARGRLVELDPMLAADARRGVAEAGLKGVEVVQGDASTTDAAAGAVPVELLLICGIFGNVPDEDIHNTIASCSALCAPGATVIWTRHRRPPDLTPQVRRWFADSGFEDVAFEAPDEAALISVGVNRLRVPPAAYVPGYRLFTFFGSEADK